MAMFLNVYHLNVGIF